MVQRLCHKQLVCVNKDATLIQQLFKLVWMTILFWQGRAFTWHRMYFSGGFIQLEWWGLYGYRRSSVVFVFSRRQVQNNWENILLNLSGQLLSSLIQCCSDQLLNECFCSDIDSSVCLSVIWFTSFICQQKPLLNHRERIRLQNLTQQLQHLTRKEREREIDSHFTLQHCNKYILSCQ